MRRAVWILVGLVLSAQAALAQTVKTWNDTKPAWKWSLEERLAKRFDPDEMEARAASVEARSRTRFPGLPEVDLHQIPERPYINGGDTPELFTPMELFISLIERGFPADGRDQREGRQTIEARAAALGFGADFWNRLGRLASPFLELRREDRRLGMTEQRGAPVSRPEPEVICALRADALAAARREFRDGPFLRLLYEAVAPGVSVPAFDEPTIRYWEGGCR
ncbi:MAG TPA: hypothetical protein VEW48_04860 [Thermoanaerobaculia bacterium]|nr:hypothetical protein [Thermoanaerobaculia bacterium]